MMYSNFFSAAVKSGGKILREQDNSVALNFGSEYSLVLKNMNSVRALVKVTIDGDDVTGTNWLVVDPNNTLELERFIRDSNFTSGNKFKFIERSAAVEEHRGIKVDDGTVRIEYKFEVPSPPITSWYNHSIQTNTPPVTWTSSYGHGTPTLTTSTITVTQNTTPLPPTRDLGGATLKSCSMNDSWGDSVQCSATSARLDSPLNEAGITVAGGESNQKFTYGSYFQTETTSHVIVFKLVGKVGDRVVEKPVTVEYKPTCTTCGKVNKATNKFCGRCGTALQIF